MSAAVSHALGLSRNQRERLMSITMGTGLALISVFLGLTLAAVATLFHSSVAVYIALPLAPLLALAVLAAPIVAPLGVFATFPVGSTGAPVGAATLQSAEAAVVIVALMVIVRRLAVGQTPLAWSPVLFWPLGLMAWMLVSMFSALDETLAIKQLVSIAGGVTFASVILASCRGMRDVRVLLWGFVLSTTILAVIALSSRSDFSESAYSGSAVLQGRLQGAFDHPNQLGALAAMAAPVAAGFLFGGRTRRGRMIAGGMLALILAALALSLARGAWLGAGMAALFMLVTLREARQKLLIIGLPVVLIFVGLWSYFPKNESVQVVTQRAEAFTTLSPYDDRDSIWREARREIKDDPWTGQGPGNFIISSARAGSEASTVAAFHAHNLFLNWAAESGLPAAAIILLFAFALVNAGRTASRLSLARGDPADRAIVIGIAGALLTVFFQGFVDYTLGNSVVHIALWGMIGAMLVASRDAGLSPRGRAVTRRSGRS
jgi:putative inorganic carbon (HCO3(-)) transporter